jgi:hypothetical protein
MEELLNQRRGKEIRYEKEVSKLVSKLRYEFKS